MTTRQPGQRVFDVLASSFLNEDVRTCFALLGDANMNWATRMADRGCRVIHVRHEHCAAAAAMAHARKSGEVGVASVTCGPGLTQLMTALPAAVRAGIPMVIFAGEAPLKAAWYNQAIDQAPFVVATGAAYIALHHPARMPVAIRDAFVQARAECRPVVLGIPMDVQNLPWEGDAQMPSPSREIVPQTQPVPPGPAAVEAAVQAIESARRVVVMAGLGAVHAADACRALAARCDAALATTLPARGLFSADPCSIGIAGGFSTETARALLARADLIVAVGCSLANHNSDAGKLWPDAKVLHVDIAPRVLSQGRVVADMHLQADAALGVRALVEGIAPRTGAWRSEISDALAGAEAKPAMPLAEDGLLHPAAVVAELERAIPAGCQLVNSSGHCSYFFAQMPSRPFSHFLTIREFGAIGNGISFAMGVSTARPGEPVVLLDGDGSLMMHVQELETIARSDMPVLIVVMNDGAYGSEIHKLRSEGLSDAGAVFGRPDLAAVARAFGLGGETVTRSDQIPGAVDRFIAAQRGAVIDIHVSDLVASPQIQRAHPKR